MYIQGGRDGLSADSVPYPHLTFRASGYDTFAVGTEGSGDDCVLVLTRRSELRACVCIPQPRGVVLRRCEDLRSVAAVGCGGDRPCMSVKLQWSIRTLFCQEFEDQGRRRIVLGLQTKTVCQQVQGFWVASINSQSQGLKIVHVGTANGRSFPAAGGDLSLNHAACQKCREYPN